MPLTVAKLRTIKATGKIERFYDGKGLYLEVTKLVSIGDSSMRLEAKRAGLRLGDVSRDEAR